MLKLAKVFCLGLLLLCGSASAVEISSAETTSRGPETKSLLPPNIIASNRFLTNADNPGVVINVDSMSLVQKDINTVSGTYILYFYAGTQPVFAWSFSTATKANTAYTNLLTYISAEAIAN